MKPAEPSFENGEVCEVADANTPKTFWRLAVYVGKNPRKESAYKHVVTLEDEGLLAYKEVRKVQKTVTVSKAEIAAWKGVHPDQLNIV